MKQLLRGALAPLLTLAVLAALLWYGAEGHGP